MAGRKATALPILTTPADDDIIYIVDVSDTSESAQGTSKQIVKSDLIPASVGVQSVTGDLVINTDPLNPVVSLPYKTWVGLISQSGTATPTASEMQNTLGAVITFSRTSGGKYTLVSDTSMFLVNKTIIFATSGGSTYSDCFVVANVINATTIQFFNYGNGGGLQDDFTNMNFEVRVYP